ncbi:uncharacterized protein LOC143518634 [Brachyhypopomus gauderio]|uniref:uncharacterized protein LOC143518634 n=1 Tax=Brachyhypopomus gauderio TaxID=698409 RepID=UPI004041FFC7
MNTRKRSSTGPYGLRKNTVPSKRLRDSLVEGASSSTSKGSKSKAAVFSIQSDAQKQEGEDYGSSINTHWTEESRNTEDVFFPHLSDSSFKAEKAEISKREAELQESLRKHTEFVEEWYIKNAAVLPDLRPHTTAAASKPDMSSITGQQSRDEPLIIHGHNVQEYNHHCVVERMLRGPSGQPRPYSLELGAKIKQRLWEELCCPTLCEEVQPDGRVCVTQTFCRPTLKRFAPRVQVDISGEPLPEQPRKKRPRH